MIPERITEKKGVLGLLLLAALICGAIIELPAIFYPDELSPKKGVLKVVPRAVLIPKPTPSAYCAYYMGPIPNPTTNWQDLRAPRTPIPTH
jgi:hypothetical protein